MIRHRIPVFLAALVAAASVVPPAPSHASGAPGDLYVTSDASNAVRTYGGTSGLFSGVFTSSSSGSGQMAIHFGATNGKVLIGHLGGGVEEHDATTGALLQTFAPGGGWQWAGVYAPNGEVYIGSQATNDVRRYHPVTGALLGILCPVPGPADMEFGPNGNLYICSYTNFSVHEVDPLTGAPISTWSLPFGERANDITFLNGNFLVTSMGTNQVWRFDPAHNLVGSFSGTGWMRPHGITISPHDGKIYAVDGVTTEVHVFDPLTFVELNPAFLTPNPGDKIVDLAFRPEPVTPTQGTSWGRMKASYR